jgi:hypothetical protein
MAAMEDMAGDKICRSSVLSMCDALGQWDAPSGVVFGDAGKNASE